MSEEELIRKDFRLKDELYRQRKEYQETYKDVREEIRDLKNQNKDLQQRVDGAIELVNKIYFGNFFSELKPIKLADSKEGKELLSILQGKE